MRKDRKTCLRGTAFSVILDGHAENRARSTMPKDLLSSICPSGDSLAGVRLRRTRDGWSADAPETAALPAPESAASEVEGAVQTEAPVEARRFCAAFPDPVTLCVESRLALFQFLELPAADADASELADMVALQLEEYKTLPLPVEDMTLATEVLEKGDESVRVLACAVPTAELDALPSRIGLAPERIRRMDVAALAALRAFPKSPPGRRLLMLGEADAVTAVFLDDGVPVLVRPLGDVSAPPAPAMRLLRLSQMQVESEQGTVRPLAGIEVASDAPLPPAWSDALRGFAGDVGEPATRKLAPAAVAEGAARRSAEGAAFDLVPAAWREEQAARSHRRGMLRVLGIGVVLWIVCALALFLGPRAIDRLAASEKAATDVLEPVVRTVSDVRHRVRLIRAYSDRTFSPLEVLREASLLLPDGITLSSMRYKREDGRVVIAATATSTSLVYEFKQNVDKSPLFRESQLTSGPTTNLRTGGADFELTILLKIPGADGEETP